MSKKLTHSILTQTTVSAGFDGFNLDTLPTDSEVIIRKTRSPSMGVKKLLERTAAFKQCLDDLKTYDINAPNPSFETDSDTAQVCILCERVHGAVLVDTPNVPGAVYADVVRNLIAYYGDIVSGGGTYITDLEARQFVFGTIRSDHTAKPYLVDLDMNVRTYDVENEDLIEEMYVDLAALAENLQTMWSAYGIYDPTAIRTLRSSLGRLPAVDPDKWKDFNLENVHTATDTLNALEQAQKGRGQR